MFHEVNLFGVYFAPFVIMMLAAWAVTLPLYAISNRYSLTTLVWHRGLFNLCIYVAVLSIIVVLSGANL